MTGNILTIYDYLDTNSLKWLLSNSFCSGRIIVTAVDHIGALITVPGECDYADALAAGAYKETVETIFGVSLQRDGEVVLLSEGSKTAAALVPINIEGERLGSLIIGPVRIRAPDGISPGMLEDCEPGWQYPGDIRDLMTISVESFKEDYDTLKELGRMLSHLDPSVRAIRNHISDKGPAICIYNSNTGKILNADNRYAGQSEIPQEKISGLEIWEINGVPLTVEALLKRRADIRNDRIEKPVSWGYYNTKFGKWFWCTTHKLHLSYREPLNVLIRLDVSELHRSEGGFLSFELYDSQLSLPNYLKLTLDMRKMKKKDERQTLVCFGISSMRSLNLVHGRGMGIKLLLEIITWLKKKMPDEAELYRIDDDIFCMRIKSANGNNTKWIASQLLDRFAKPWLLDTGKEVTEFFCEAAISIIYMDTKSEKVDIRALIERTIHASKNNYSVLVYNEQTDSAAKEQLRLGINLRNSINQGMHGFEIHYQPIVELKSGNWKALEALCRWKCAGLGQVPPIVFIREAERSGLIYKLGEWVLDNAVNQCRNMDICRQDGFFLSVNISPLQIADKGFATMVENILSRYEYPGKKLNLEVTETTEFTLSPYAKSVIDRLRRHGITITLDDFGMGYSSLANLKNFHVDYLKTEREFLQGIEDDESLQALYQMMSDLSHANDIKLIAEGVETLEQLEFTKKNGADFIQGFFFSKPLTLKELAG